ncbi:MAG: TolC family protein [Planctomyces sp.]|nr:TolC family protein [Planctomyces sp.]
MHQQHDQQSTAPTLLTAACQWIRRGSRQHRGRVGRWFGSVAFIAAGAWYVAGGLPVRLEAQQAKSVSAGRATLRKPEFGQPPRGSTVYPIRLSSSQLADEDQSESDVTVAMPEIRPVSRAPLISDEQKPNADGPSTPPPPIPRPYSIPSPLNQPPGSAGSSPSDGGLPAASNDYQVSPAPLTVPAFRNESATMPGGHSGYGPALQGTGPALQGTGRAPQGYGPAQQEYGPAPGTSGFRATVEADAPAWLGEYMSRSEHAQETGTTALIPGATGQLPPELSVWWDDLVLQHLGIAPNSASVDVGTLVQNAMLYSPQVLALQAEPEVQQRIVLQEEAAFDWRSFLETTYDDLNDPVGNTLTTGNNDDRFSDRNLRAAGGFRRKTETGGEFEISQRVGHQSNNSLFLLPNPQSTSRLELSFRQPLLSQRGVSYNQNQIVLARIATSSSSDEVLEELQSHLFRVTEAYWQLYRARAEYFQRQKLLTSAQQVLNTLEARNQVDTIPRQILRARAAVARAEARMQRAVTSIRNSESQLRLLVNDPAMLNSGPVELTPAESPSTFLVPVHLRESLQTALINRPDVSRAIRQMRASSVRLGVSKSELLPKLDFIVSSYVAGLEDHSKVPESIGNQFTDGRPGYTVGLEFEVPLGNRAARAKQEQRQWELKRSMNVFRATVESALTEVEVANREVETAYREMVGRYHAMVAAQNETSYLKDRFEVLPMAEESAMLLLEDLLDGYERLADEESTFVESQIAYALSIIELRRSTGVLLRTRHEAPEIRADESGWMTDRMEDAISKSPAKRELTSPEPRGPAKAERVIPVSQLKPAASVQSGESVSSGRYGHSGAGR